MEGILTGGGGGLFQQSVVFRTILITTNANGRKEKPDMGDFTTQFGFMHLGSSRKKSYSDQEEKNFGVEIGKPRGPTRKAGNFLPIRGI